MFDPATECFFGETQSTAHGVDGRRGGVGNFLHRVPERNSQGERVGLDFGKLVEQRAEQLAPLGCPSFFSGRDGQLLFRLGIFERIEPVIEVQVPMIA